MNELSVAYSTYVFTVLVEKFSNGEVKLHQPFNHALPAFLESTLLCHNLVVADERVEDVAASIVADVTLQIAQTNNARNRARIETSFGTRRVYARRK